MEQKIITITHKEKKLVASLRIDWEKKEIEVIENKNYNIYDGETLVQVSGNSEGIKGIGLPIYDPKGKWIGNILVNEKLEVVDWLKYGYKIGEEGE